MRTMTIRVLSAVAVLALPFATLATPSATPQPKTTAAVIAVDEGWDKAEDTGDTAYIDDLLLPDYRSVNADGSVHHKAAILSGAKNVSSPEHAAKVAKWRAAHPMGTLAMVHGDTAIVTFYLKPLGPEKGIMSSDIFVYRDGH